MANKFWGVDIQAEIAGAATPSDLPNFYLQKRASGIRDPLSLAGGTNDGPPVNYACHGMITDYSSDEMRELPLVQKGDKRIMLIAKPLADLGVLPEPEDLIISGARTYTVIDVSGNSAEAVWLCQCRG